MTISHGSISRNITKVSWQQCRCIDTSAVRSHVTSSLTSDHGALWLDGGGDGKYWTYKVFLVNGATIFNENTCKLYFENIKKIVLPTLFDWFEEMVCFSSCPWKWLVCGRSLHHSALTCCVYWPAVAQMGTCSGARGDRVAAAGPWQLH